MSESKSIVIYHANCPDGWASAYIAAKALGLKDEELLSATYGNYSDALNKAINYVGYDGHIYILDFSISVEDVLNVCNAGIQLVMLDHHATAEAALKDIITPSAYTTAWETEFRTKFNLIGPLPFVRFNPHGCGATMTYDYLNLNDARLSVIANYARDRDLWLWQMPSSRPINAYMASFDTTITAWDELHLHQQTPFTIALVAGESLIRAQDRRVRQACRKASKCSALKTDAWKIKEKEVAEGRMYVPAEWNYMHGLAVGAYADISEIGNALVNQGVDFALIYSVENNGDVVCSLRSKGETSVREIAERFGGGGHKNAAGFKLKRGMLDSVGAQFERLVSTFSIDLKGCQSVYCPRVEYK